MEEAKFNVGYMFFSQSEVDESKSLHLNNLLLAKYDFKFKHFKTIPDNKISLFILTFCNIAKCRSF